MSSGPVGSVAPLVFVAVVDDAERPAFVAAAEQLQECLSAAQDRREIRLDFAPSFAAIGARAPTTVVVASLYADVARDEPMPATEARWRSQVSSLPVTPAPIVFICTVFRHVARGAPDDPTSRGATTRERIRRLNLFAAELSHDTGIGIIDIDRAFAHLGARGLETDYRLSGRMAAEAAAHTIVGNILSSGLDDAVAPDVLQRAMQFQGAPWQISALLQRRLGQRV